MDHVTRRRAVGLTAAGTATLLAAGGATTPGLPRQATQPPTATTTPVEPKAGYPVFSGSSKTGNFEEALKDAIEKARASAPGADRQVRWVLRQVSGVNGGIAPLNTLTVEIHATIT